MTLRPLNLFSAKNHLENGEGTHVVKHHQHVSVCLNIAENFCYIKYLAGIQQMYYNQQKHQLAGAAPALPPLQPSPTPCEKHNVGVRSCTTLWRRPQSHGSFESNLNRFHLSLLTLHPRHSYQNIKQSKICKPSSFCHTFLSAYFGSSGRTIIILPSGYSAKILSFFHP